MQTQRQVAANLQTKPTDLGCESADRLLSSTSSSPFIIIIIIIIIITQPTRAILIYHQTKGGRLSLPRHIRVCSLCPKLYIIADHRDLHCIIGTWV